MRAVAIGLTAVVAGLAWTSVANAATAEYDPSTVIVKYRDGASGSERLAAAARAGVVRTLGTVAGVAARVVSVDGDPALVARRLSASAAVLYAEPNYIFRATAERDVPADAAFRELYGLDNFGQAGGLADADIDAPEGWAAARLGTGSDAVSGMKVGIVDTGVRASHPDLAGKVVNCAGVRSFGLNLLLFSLGGDPTVAQGRCDDDNGHGTHVAGTAAGLRGGGAIVGVAYTSPLAICKALDSSGSGSVAGIANCMSYLVGAGARVISLSLSATADSQTMREAVDAASRTALVVAAAGNGGDTTPNYPAYYDNVVSVGATDNRDQPAAFSTHNADVEVAAPGVNILSAWSDGAYKVLSGTSMATPHAAGVAAVIAGRYRAGTPTLWRQKLDAAVDDIGAAGRDPYTGHGRLNLLKAATG